MNFLIRDVLIVPPLGESPFDDWVEIVDDKIAAVGRGRRQAGAGQAVIEGGGCSDSRLVNTRTPIRASRAAAPRHDARKMAGGDPARAVLTDEQAYVGALATYAEALLSVTTTIFDMCIRPRSVLAAARDIGIRAVIVPYVADTMPFAPSLQCG